ncbi:acid protease [Suhomyces tanzawaensis NRRL Y-17324]|uniref:candidapepsin n=1 Tax=Suhomyces tanzawaensis NRRL Y-17324 TaxID=984487 RepID=A0A1E4SD44_9ASCO|nr:acid protease [Suhomyces tanzawaensis NRRL Y-17324]ODV77425.1 acid protease [Suhomyces tanzawaensis NRRL Y-17324]
MLSFSYGIVALLAVAVNGLAVPEVSNHESRDNLKVLSMDFNVNRDQSTAPLIKRRATGVSSTIENRYYFYSMELYVGSDKQKNVVSVDTGSSDLWVVGKGAQCSDTQCFEDGSFDGSTSSTFKNLNLPYTFKYIDGTSTLGTYVTDDVTIPGGVTVKNQQFAVSNKTTLGRGLLGLGLVTEEARYYQDLPGVEDYPNLPVQLKNQGTIKKSAYSMYLNAPDSQSGVILFGGIDKAKYEEPLTTRKGFSTKRLGITVDSIEVGGNSLTYQGATIFDSGYSFSRLPQNVLDAITNEVKSSNGALNCSPPEDSSILLKIGDTVVKVPLSSLVTNASNGCSLTVSLADPNDFNNLPTLGDDVLRHAYVVYNLDDNTIGVAQAKYSNSTDIVEI